MAGELKIDEIRYQFTAGDVLFIPVDGDGWEVTATLEDGTAAFRTWQPDDYPQPMAEPTLTRARSFLRRLLADSGRGWCADDSAT